MSDVFISYASADRARAGQLADLLRAQGWSVWWDRTIPPGQEFDEVIEKALDASACVVVLWSRTSVASSWVKTEAADAMRRKILVPALIEDTKIPLEFRRLQAADLSRLPAPAGGAPDAATAQQLDALMQSVREVVGSPTTTAEAAPSMPGAHASAEPTPGMKRVAEPLASPLPPPIARPAATGRRTPLVAGLLGLVVLALVAAVLYQWHAASSPRADPARSEVLAEAERTAAQGRQPQSQRAADPAEGEPKPPVRVVGVQPSRNAGGDAVELVSISPAPGTALRSNAPMEFIARIRFRLASADSAILAVYAERYQAHGAKCVEAEPHQTEGGSRAAVMRGEREVNLRFTWNERAGAKSVLAGGAADLGLGINLWTNANGFPVEPTLLKTGPLVCYEVVGGN